VTQYS